MFPLISEKAVEEAVRNCEQLKRREQEEDFFQCRLLSVRTVRSQDVLDLLHFACSSVICAMQGKLMGH